MKKFSGLIAVLMIVISLFVFVACGDTNKKEEKEETVKLTEDMTIEDVKSALKDVESFTIETHESNGAVPYVCKYIETGYSSSDSIENDLRTYLYIGKMYYWFSERNGITQYGVCNTEGYDSSFVNYYSEDIKQNALENVYNSMKINGYYIKDNKIFVNRGTDYEGNTLIDCVKGFGVTQLDFPEEYKDNYKTLGVTYEVLQYTDFSSTTCGLTKIGITLKSLTIPETYNGKTVVSADIGDHVDFLVIPTTINSIGGLYGVQDITYLGTKAEWRNVYTDIISRMGEYIRTVHCSDGDIATGDKAW